MERLVKEEKNTVEGVKTTSVRLPICHHQSVSLRRRYNDLTVWTNVYEGLINDYYSYQELNCF